MKIKYEMLFSSCNYVRIVFMFINCIHYSITIIIFITMRIFMYFYLTGIQLILDRQIADFLIQVTIGETVTT